MAVIAIGNDISEVPRIRETYRRHERRFLNKVFTEEEQDYCLKRFDPAIHLAARFAVKEAVMKVLGTGRARGVSWRDIGVTRRPGKRPYAILIGRAKTRAEGMGILAVHITITHTRGLAMATAVGEGDLTPPYPPLDDPRGEGTRPD